VTRILLILALVLAPFGATAQRETSLSTIEDRHRAADHSDLLPGEGASLGFIGTRDSDRFESRRTRLGALVNYESPYDFRGIAAGTDYYRQDAWSERGYSLWGILEKRDRATAGGITAIVGALDVADHSHLLVDAVWNHRFSARTGSELQFQRNVVESRAAIDAGIRHNFLAASLDHAFTDRLTGIVLGGGQRYSDDNERIHLRGWLIYSLFPEHGLALQLRARGYDSSRRGSLFYFNPERYENADIGLRWRAAVSGWRIFATAAAGEERIDHDVTNPTRFVQLHVDRVLAKDIRVGARYAYSRAAGEDGGNGSGSYTWRYLRFFVVAPF